MFMDYKDRVSTKKCFLMIDKRNLWSRIINVKSEMEGSQLDTLFSTIKCEISI